MRWWKEVRFGKRLAQKNKRNEFKLESYAQTGDSGGPLIYLGLFGPGKYKLFQYGIVSFGLSSSNGVKPAVYTSVKHYINWILANIEQS